MASSCDDARAWSTRPLHDALGAEVVGADTAALQSGSESVCKFLRSALDIGLGLLLLRVDTNLWDAAAMRNFTSCFGQLEDAPVDGNYERFLEPGDGRVHVFSKVPSARVFDTHSANEEQRHATVWDPRTGRPSWHTDQSFRSPPARFSSMYCVRAPAFGGDTLYAGAVAAYAALPPAQRKFIDTLSANHSYEALASHFRRQVAPALHSSEQQHLSAERRESHAALGAAVHPMTRPHASGGRSLYLAPTVIEAVVETCDPSTPVRATRALVDELAAHCTEPRFVYRHRWRAGDLVLWDNFATMHAAMALRDIDTGERTMWRTTVAATAESGADEPNQQ